MSELSSLANEVSLLDELSGDKEYKEPGQKNSDFSEVNPSDFDALPAQSNGEGLFPAEQGDEVKKQPSMTAEETTESALAMFDTSCTMIFVPLLNRRLKRKFTEEEQDRLFELADADEEGLSQEDKNLLKRYERLKNEIGKKKKKVPFQEDEYDLMRPPMLRMVEKHGVDIPPGLALAFAASKVIGLRLIELMND